MRWILLISVIAGGFLSGGEGVRLFPFSSDRSQEGPHDLRGGGERTYTLSVHNPSQSLVRKAKFRDILAAPGPVDLARPLRLLPYLVIAPDNYERYDPFVNDAFPLLAPGRAPPVA